MYSYMLCEEIVHLVLLREFMSFVYGCLQFSAFAEQLEANEALLCFGLSQH